MPNWPVPESRAAPVRAVTLDLDGTLVDSIVDLAAACDAMLCELGQAPLGAGRIHRFVGKGMVVLVERCLAAALGAPVEASLRDRAVQVFRRHYAVENGRRARVYPGVVDGLKALAALDLPLAVVTNKPAEYTAPLLERVGLAGYFAHAVSGDTTAWKKPHPGPILHASQLLGVPPAAIVHIGDSDNDVRAARAAGCRAFVVPYGYTEEGPVDSGDCDALVSDLLDAARQVAALNQNPIRLRLTS